MRDSGSATRYLVPLRRWWPVMAVAVVAGGFLALLTLPDAAPESSMNRLAEPGETFQATQILFRDPSLTGAPSFDLVLLLAQRGDLANRVSESMDGRVGPAEVQSVALEADSDIGTLSITAIHRQADVAESLARTYAADLNEFIAERAGAALADDIARAEERLAELTVEIETLEGEVAALADGDVSRRLLEAELDGLLGQYGAEQSNLQGLQAQARDVQRPFETLQEAAAVSTFAMEEATLALPDSPAPWILAFVFLALAGGVAAVFAIDHFDTRIRTRHDAEDAFGLPVIAELPTRSRGQLRQHPLPVYSEPDGVTAEAIRSLRLAVRLAPTWRLAGEVPTHSGAVGSVAPIREHEPPRSLVVTSTTTGEGKTTLVANLAASFAESGQRVLVVDCDFRRPAVSGLLHGERGTGLRNLPDPYGKPLKDFVVATAIEGVALVRSGEPGIAPPWFLAHSATIVEQAVDLADVVLIDTGPMLLTNEATALIPSVDAVLLVNRSGRVTFMRARETVEQLTRIGANVAGIVMMDVRGQRRYGYYEPYSSEGDADPGDASTERTTRLPTRSDAEELPGHDPLGT
jgi:capsular exopolysaccharide synthesis family protein